MSRAVPMYYNSIRDKMVEVRQEYCRAHHLTGNYRTASDTWIQVSTNTFFFYFFFINSFRYYSVLCLYTDVESYLNQYSYTIYTHVFCIFWECLISTSSCFVIQLYSLSCYCLAIVYRNWSIVFSFCRSDCKYIFIHGVVMYVLELR